MGIMSRIIKQSTLTCIRNPQGDIFHALKSTDREFQGFGEVYFSQINYGCIKAWKRHLKMTLNLVCPVGKVKFAFFTDKLGYESAIIGKENYKRLTVPPGVWFGFQGMERPFSLIMNVADILHDPKEIERKKLDSMSFPTERLS